MHYLAGGVVWCILLLIPGSFTLALFTENGLWLLLLLIPFAFFMAG